MATMALHALPILDTPKAREIAGGGHSLAELPIS